MEPCLARWGGGFAVRLGGGEVPFTCWSSLVSKQIVIRHLLFPDSCLLLISGMALEILKGVGVGKVLAPSLVIEQWAGKGRLFSEGVLRSAKQVLSGVLWPNLAGAVKGVLAGSRLAVGGGILNQRFMNRVAVAQKHESPKMAWQMAPKDQNQRFALAL